MFLNSHLNLKKESHSNLLQGQGLKNASRLNMDMDGVDLEENFSFEFQNE